MKKQLFAKNTDNKFAYLLLAPGFILLIALIGYPLLYNIFISVQDVPLNPNKPSVFIGLQNYYDLFTDINFYKSLLTTFLFTFLVVGISTAFGLAIAVFLNRNFFGKKFVNAIIILSYVVPSISLVFIWRYMFNNIYGFANYVIVDILKVVDTAPLWFDNTIIAFIVVVLFCVWRFFPYAYISFRAILQTIDKTIYEAAVIDGANWWQQFQVVTFPAIKPVLATVISLRTIWVFYLFTEVYLLTKRVDLIGIYLYEMAFATNDLGKAAAISIVLFVLIFSFVLLIRKKVFKSE